MTESSSSDRLKQALASTQVRVFGEPEAHVSSVAEVLDGFAQYTVDIVEAFGLCPYSMAARSKGAMALGIFYQRDASLEALKKWAGECAANEALEVLFAIYPSPVFAREAFQDFFRTARTSLERPSNWAVEPFHPDAEEVHEAEAQATDKDHELQHRIVPFLRRTPHASLQLTRLTVLDRIRQQNEEGTCFLDVNRPDLAAWLSRDPKQSITETIASRNLKTWKTQRDVLAKMMSRRSDQR